MTAPYFAFTLLELCLVIAAVTLIGMTMLPALARTRPNTGISQCLNDAKQLAAAVQMYTADNTDLYPPNPDDGNAPAGYSWCRGNVQGGAPDPIPLGPETFNPDIERGDFVDPSTHFNGCLIAAYLGKDGGVFTCPADPRIGVYQGSVFSMLGKKVRAARSVSMNGAVGTADPGWLGPNGAAMGTHSGKPLAPVPGSWLAGAPRGANQHDNPWATFGKTADFRVVKPSQIFLTADEDPYSINDGVLIVSAGTAEFIDYPATYHDHASILSFCDGHVELHRWTGSLIVLNAPAYIQTVPSSGPDFADWNWLWQHATVRMK